MDAVPTHLVGAVDLAIIVSSPAFPYSFERLLFWKRQLTHIIGLQWMLVASRVEMLALPSVIETLRAQDLAPVTPDEYVDFYVTELANPAAGASPPQTAAVDGMQRMSGSSTPLIGSPPSPSEARRESLRYPPVFAVSARVDRGKCLANVAAHICAAAASAFAAPPPQQQQQPQQSVSSPPTPSNSITRPPTPEGIVGEGWCVIAGALPKRGSALGETESVVGGDGELPPGRRASGAAGAAEFEREWARIVTTQAGRLEAREEWLRVQAEHRGGGCVYFSRAEGSATRTVPRTLVQAALLRGEPWVAGDVADADAARAAAFARLLEVAATGEDFRARKAVAMAAQTRQAERAAELAALHRQAAAELERRAAELRELRKTRDAAQRRLEALRRERAALEDVRAARRLVAEDAAEAAAVDRIRTAALAELATLEAAAEAHRARERDVDTELPRQREAHTAVYIAKLAENRAVRAKLRAVEAAIKDAEAAAAAEKADVLTGRLEPHLEALEAQIQRRIREHDALADELLALQGARWVPRSHAAGGGAVNTPPNVGAPSKAHLVYRRLTGTAADSLERSACCLAASSAEVFAVAADFAELETTLLAGWARLSRALPPADANMATDSVSLLSQWRAAFERESWNRRAIMMAEESQRVSVIAASRLHNTLRMAHEALRVHRWKLESLKQ